MRAPVVDRAHPRHVRDAPEVSRDRIAEALGRWQARELRLARNFRECAGLTPQELEDIYQDTVLVLLDRRYESEEHLRNALHAGLKMRALRCHSKELRREEITNGLQASEYGDERDSPEHSALIREDRLIVAEFLAGLNTIEQRVFCLHAEGMRYRAIATTLGVDVNVARNAERACERRREHFQLLYDTGRLCRFRASTIKALQGGQATSDALAGSALAHLERCATCRAEHRTNAKRLRLRFQDQAAVLLPTPAFLSRASRLVNYLGVRARVFQHRLTVNAMPISSPDIRERSIALLAGGGAAGKVAVGAASVALIAGAVGATHALDHDPSRHLHHVGSPASNVHPSGLAGTLQPRVQADVHRDSNISHEASKPKRAGHVVPLGQNLPGKVVSLHAPHPIGPRQYELSKLKRLSLPKDRAPLQQTSTQTRPLHQRGGGPFSP
jgi:DNA-directed RNA polymerase specialized sigma24 family protein